MKIRYNHSCYSHQHISGLLFARVTRIVMAWVSQPVINKNFDVYVIFATDDETAEDITHLLLQQLWREPPELTFLVSAKKTTSFSYNPTPLLPDFDVKALTQINNSFYLDNNLISGVILLCPVNFSPTLPNCPNCGAIWDFLTGCNRCGLSPLLLDLTINRN